MALKDVPEIAEEFESWEAWISLVGGQCHARLRGSVPIVMVHADTLDALRAQIERYLGLVR
jgi:hypothetical protein